MSVPSRADALALGRESVLRHAWGEAFAQLSSADSAAPLQPDDLERLAECAQLLGRYADSEALLSRLHHASLADGDSRRAARAAFKLGMSLITQGEVAQGGGWLARAQRVLDEAGDDCVERGYLLLPVGRRHLLSGDSAAGYAAFESAAAIGARFGDRDLMTFGRHGMGRAVLQQGHFRRGVALLDEAMVAVLAGEVSPLLSGIIYCSVIEACHQVFDLGRAREWTAALTEWCASQPELVPFRGHCQIHRAELLQLTGDWSDALDQAKGAETPGGDAFYRVAELHRLRGEFAEAEAAYRQASERGRRPHPGLAQLRLAQGRVDAASAAIRAAADDVRSDPDRAELFAASVEILLAAGDVPGARAAADEIAAIALRVDAPYLRARSSLAAGAVLLAEADPRGALPHLRMALATWQELGAPYEAARARVLIGLAGRGLGDLDGAEMELAGARRIFEQLGAAGDLARTDSLAAERAPVTRGDLTPREIEVLRLVASGRTNRAIAGELGISEKTVARHISNIFTKLGLSSRAGATAWAYERGLAGPST